MRKNRGFTLIELLVVVTIIGLLIAILLPSLGKARDRAKISACAANLHSDAQGALLYASDWQAWLPPEYARYSLPYSEQAPPAGGFAGMNILMYLSGNGGNWGFNSLLMSGVISDGRTMFDPANPTGSTFAPTKPGPINAGNYGSMTFNGHGGYFYQLHSDQNWSSGVLGTGSGKIPPKPDSVICTNTTGTPAAGTLLTGAAYPKTLDFPNNLFLASCFMGGGNNGSSPHGSGFGANGAFGDAHVEYILGPVTKVKISMSGLPATDTERSTICNLYEGQSAKNK